jgi:hypothetical protein
VCLNTIPACIPCDYESTQTRLIGARRGTLLMPRGALIHYTPLKNPGNHTKLL